MYSTKTARDLADVARADLRQLADAASTLRADLAYNLRYLRGDIAVDVSDTAGRLRARLAAWRDRRCRAKVPPC